MRVYLCGDTAHDPGLKEEHGHAEREPRKKGGLQEGRTGDGMGNIVRSECEARFYNMLGK